MKRILNENNLNELYYLGIDNNSLTITNIREKQVKGYLYRISYINELGLYLVEWGVCDKFGNTNLCNTKWFTSLKNAIYQYNINY